MRFEQIVQAFAQAIGEAAAHKGKFMFNDADNDEAPNGTPVADFVDSGCNPEKLKLALGNSDKVRVIDGDRFSLAVEGDASHLHFRLTEDALHLFRRGGSGAATTITLTMPRLRHIAMAGAGKAKVETLQADGGVAIAGAGKLKIGKLSGGSFSAKLAGAGRIEAAGAVDELKLAVAGAGKFAGRELEVERAIVKLGGAGKAEFASDGEVQAKIAGIGKITVYGNARCSLKSAGAGQLRTVPRGEAEAEAA